MQALLGLRRRLCAATAGCCPRSLPRQLPTVVPLTLLCRPFYVTSADVSTATEANPNGTIEYDRHSFNAIIGKADIVDYYLPVWETCATEANAVRHTTCTPPPPPQQQQRLLRLLLLQQRQQRAACIVLSLQLGRGSTHAH